MNKKLKIKIVEFISAVIKELDLNSNFKWKLTSWIRNSPSHKTGLAFDIAPDLLENKTYGVSRRKDPFLNFRKDFIVKLKLIQPFLINQDFIPVIFVESDHLHIYLYENNSDNRNLLSTKELVVSIDKDRDDIYRDARNERMSFNKQMLSPFQIHNRRLSW
jgi:hypothetical protein